MKKSKLTFSLILILMVCLSAGSCSAWNRMVSDENEVSVANKTISVQGAASITVAPTVAYVNIGVTTFNKEAVIAQKENAEKMEKVYKALDSLEISKEKIKTVTYYISPRYDYTKNISTLAGYDVTNGIQVTVMDLTKVSQVLDMTVEQGVNNASSISFSITDQENDDIYLQALAAAVDNAKAKAEALAGAAGLSLGKPLQIIEGSPSYVVPIRYDSSYSKDGSSSTPVSGGELKVKANVTVIYK